MLARRLIRGRDAEFILADLDDDHAQTVRRSGAWRARVRYWRLVVASAWTSRRGVSDAAWSGRQGASSGLGHDLRFAVRMLRKNPGFTLVTVLTLALGIGANTAIFGVLNGVLLRPLPYEQPGELVNVWQVFRDWQRSDIATFRAMAERFPISWPVYREWTRRSHGLEAIAAYSDGRAIVYGGDGAEVVGVVEVTRSLRAVLGVEPQLGRWFTADEDRTGGDAVAVISHGFWQRHFGGVADIAGRELRISGEPHTVIGVMPTGFYFPEREFDVWVRIDDERRNERWTNQSMSTIGRLADGVGMAVAQAEMDQVAEQIRADFPDAIDAGVRLVGRVDDVAGSTGSTVLLLMASVGLVLVVAVANVAGLLLVRASARRHEFAIRIALGARRTRLFVQMLVEGGLLALLGGALGLLTVVWTFGWIQALLPPATPRLADIAIDWRVLAFAAVVSAVVALGFALAAALHSAVSGPVAGLRASRTVVGRQRGRAALVVGEVAVSVVLLTAATLLVTSYLRLDAVDRGFRQDGLLTLRSIGPMDSWGDSERLREFHESVLQRIAVLPGVDGAAGVSSLPFSGGQSSTSFELVQAPQGEQDTGWSLKQRVTAGYFDVMGVALRRGRWFDRRDLAAGSGVVVVNERFAAHYYPDGDAVGQTIWEDGEPFAIIGVVADLKHRRLEEEVERKRYAPVNRRPQRALSLVVRTEGDPTAMAPAVRAAILEVDRMATVTDVASMSRLVAAATALPRFRSLMLAVLALVAVVLAATGVYGVVAIAVAGRTREIGLRMTLGALSGVVLRQVVVGGLKLIAPGVVLGMGGAYAAARLVESWLFEVAATEPAVFLGVAVAVALLATVATCLPAWRAAKVDPLVALRSD